MIRFIEVRITPFAHKMPAGGEIHEIEVTVRTTLGRYTKRTTIPETIFQSGFHHMLEQIEREVIEQSGVANN